MRWRSWVRFLCFVLIAALLIFLGRAAANVPWRNGWWVPSVACPLGLLLLFIYRKGNEPTRPRSAWLFSYALALCVIDPLIVVAEWPHAAPLFVLPLAPLVWVGVVGLRRGERVRAVGAWLVVSGQFYAIVYNKTHLGAMAGCCKFVYTLW